MSSDRFSDDFKRDAVAQITERGYPVREVSGRLGVSPYSPYAWKKAFAKASSGDGEKDIEIRRLKRELARAVEESDILNEGEPSCAIGSRPMASAYFARDASFSGHRCAIP